MTPVDLKLYAWVGEDEFDSGEVGLKQVGVPAGTIPLVVIESHCGKLLQKELLRQLQAQATRYKKTIRLVRFHAVETVLELEP